MDNLKSVENEYYIYKEVTYECPPIKRYYEIRTVIDGTTAYTTIKKKMSPILLFIIFIILASPMVFINMWCLATNYMIGAEHKMSVPTEMYFDKRSNTLDVDITNDESNLQNISVTVLEEDGSEVCSLKGISPGESIGAVPLSYYFNKLPSKCTVYYEVWNKGVLFKSIITDILIVDREIADMDDNRDF